MFLRTAQVPGSRRSSGKWRSHTWGWGRGRGWHRRRTNTTIGNWGWTVFCLVSWSIYRLTDINWTHCTDAWIFGRYNIVMHVSNSSNSVVTEWKAFLTCAEMKVLESILSLTAVVMMDAWRIVGKRARFRPTALFLGLMQIVINLRSLL
jgi:hypothetical protein